MRQGLGGVGCGWAGGRWGGDGLVPFCLYPDPPKISLRLNPGSTPPQISSHPGSSQALEKD